MRLEQDLGTEEQGMFIDRTCKTNWTLSDSGAAIRNAIVGLHVDHGSRRWASADATLFSQIDYRFAVANPHMSAHPPPPMTTMRPSAS
jgi:hypothetical protein